MKKHKFFVYLKIILAFYICLINIAPVCVAAVDTSQKVYDYAEILTDAEETALADASRTMFDAYDMDFIILTINSNDGKGDMNYADDFYDDNLFGYGKNFDGLLLQINMGERGIWISTCGRAIDIFTDRILDNMINEIGSYLSDARYFNGCKYFLDEAGRRCDIANNSSNTNNNTNNYDYNHDYSNDNNSGYNYDYSVPRNALYGIGMDLVVGIAAGGIVVGIIGLFHSSAKGSRPGAVSYLDKKNTNILDKGSHFVRSFVKSTPRAQNTSSGGGSSTHRSSGGRTHGGRGGKF